MAVFELLTACTADHVDTEKGTQYETAILIVDSIVKVPATMASPWLIKPKIVPTTSATLLLRIKISFVNAVLMVPLKIILFCGFILLLFIIIIEQT